MSNQQQSASYPVDWQLYLRQLLFGPSTATEYAHVTCRWVTAYGHECGVILPADRDLVAAHLRSAHNIRGEGRELTTCMWRDCCSRPIQRRARIRHVLSIHLGLLRWTCPQCFRTFARKWTKHTCQPGDDVLPYARREPPGDDPIVLFP